MVDENFAGTSVTLNQDHSDGTDDSWDRAGNLVNDGTYRYTYDAWNRLVAVKSSKDSGAVTFQTAEFDAAGRRIKKVVTNSGEHDATIVFQYDGHKIIETRLGGQNTFHQQFIHGTQYIDELVIMRLKDQGDLYVHQGERSERSDSATGKASRMRASGIRARPQDGCTMRPTEGANWNVIALTDLGGKLVESLTRRGERRSRPPLADLRFAESGESRMYTPYGQVTVFQETGFGGERSDRQRVATGKASTMRASGPMARPEDASTRRIAVGREGDQDVDSTNKATPGSTCTGGALVGACRVLDLDFDGDYDSADGGLFDSLPQGYMVRAGLPATMTSQPFAHQGLLHDAELASYQSRSRHYTPRLRRCIQRDQLPFLGMAFRTSAHYQDGLNMFSYVFGNPTSAGWPRSFWTWGHDSPAAPA